MPHPHTSQTNHQSCPSHLSSLSLCAILFLPTKGPNKEQLPPEPKSCNHLLDEHLAGSSTAAQGVCKFFNKPFGCDEAQCRRLRGAARLINRRGFGDLKEPGLPERTRVRNFWMHVWRWPDVWNPRRQDEGTKFMFHNHKKMDSNWTTIRASRRISDKTDKLESILSFIFTVQDSESSYKVR